MPNEIITDKIANACNEYRKLTGLDPDRIYLGIAQRLELERFIETHPKKADVTKDRVMGMRVYKVNVRSHMYVAGDLNHA